MHFSIALLFASAASAAVIPTVPHHVKVKTSGAISIKAKYNDHYIPNGPAALRKALLKYKLPMPFAESKLNGANGKTAGLGLHMHQQSDNGTGEGTVGAKPAPQDIQYICPVEIGGQTLNLNFDTGSADLWVISTQTKPETKGHNVFDPRKSSSWKEMKNSEWKISYGDGSSASGIVGTDTVTVGNTTVDGQAVEIAQHISDQFVKDTISDGLLGLAFSNINTIKPRAQKTFFENLSDNLDNKVFTATLKHQALGSYDFGYVDSSKHDGEIQYTKVDKTQGFWQFPAKSYKINGKTYTDNAKTVGIADTGTTLLLMSKEVAKKYYATVKGAKLDESQGGYTFPCDAELPDIEVAVGDKFATVSGKFINFAPVTEGGSTCFGGLQGYETKGDAPLYIYGDVFLKGYLAVFDLEKEQFGFAPQKNLNGTHTLK